MIRDDPYSLKTFKTKFNSKNKPPLISLSHFLFDNPICDLENIKVLVRARSEVGEQERIVDKEMDVKAAFDETRELADDTDKFAFFKESMYNYDVIAQKLIDLHPCMANIIYMMELYLKDSDQTWMDIKIPEKSIIKAVLKLTDVVDRTVKDTMFKLSQSVKFSTTEIDKVMHEKYDEIAEKTSESMQAILTKVKTDIDSSNVEDTKRAIFGVINLIRVPHKSIKASHKGILCVFLLDYLEKLASANFKNIDRIESKTVNLSELAKELNIRFKGTVSRDVQPLLALGFLKQVGKGGFKLNLKGLPTIFDSKTS